MLNFVLNVLAMKRVLFFLFLTVSFYGYGQKMIIYDTMNSKIPDNLIKTITIDSSGNIWFVTGDCFGGGNLVKYDNITYTEYDTLDGIPDRFITSIAFDTNDVMWCGSRYHGISSYDGKQWKNYNPSNSVFPDKHVRSVTIDKHNRVWVGTDNGLAVYVNNKWDVMNKNNSALPDNVVSSVACDKNSYAIWIATDKGVLYAYDYGAIKQMINVAPYVFNKENSLLPDNQVNEVVVDDSSNVWISYWGGIAKIDHKNGKWNIFSPQNSKLPDYVEYIMTPYKNQLWVATNNGLHILKNGQWQSYTPSNSSIADFFINRVVFDKEGNAWIATQSGLVKFINQ
jgi:ligand-binding sensor domain-containing protein